MKCSSGPMFMKISGFTMFPIIQKQLSWQNSKMAFEDQLQHHLAGHNLHSQSNVRQVSVYVLNQYNSITVFSLIPRV